MPKISLTTFIDFVHKSNSPRLTCVRQAKKQYESKESFPDYWRLLREQIIKVHKENLGLDALDEVLSHVKDPRRKQNYKICIENYKCIFKRKDVNYSGSAKKIWTHSELDISVNPEFFIIVDGIKYMAKLHFKSKLKLDINKLHAIFYLMELTRPRDKGEYSPAMIDLRNCKIIPKPSRQIPNIDMLLNVEASAFLDIWNRL